ncbi:c-type cytochrome domain-containing protein, partial [Cyclobacterium plantarum]|uniref:c-type cytochrome domain-containing protein n=1 Tax=Cyclobacterium plantarum TaxID=2716263 RepID=UPI003F6F102D
MLRHPIYFIFFLSVLSSACSEKPSSGISLGTGDQVSYNFHVRPILSDNCFACHGPDENKRESGLRLDMAESAYAALKENPGAHAIVPGKPSASEVVRRLETSDETEMMPPPESNLQLTEEEKETIRKWIKQGAAYEPHWAFVPPVQSDLPEVSDPEWAQHEIDHFILAKLDRLGL